MINLFSEKEIHFEIKLIVGYLFQQHKKQNNNKKVE
jgi:hypothetical protein